MRLTNWFLMGLSAAILLFGLGSQAEAVVEARDIVVHSATIDITHFKGVEPTDQVDLTTTFTNNELAEKGTCEPARTTSSRRACW